MVAGLHLEISLPDSFLRHPFKEGTRFINDLGFGTRHLLSAGTVGRASYQMTTRAMYVPVLDILYNHTFANVQAQERRTPQSYLDSWLIFWEGISFSNDDITLRK